MNALIEKPIYDLFSRALWIINSINNNIGLNFFAERSILTDLLKAIPDSNFGKRKKNESGIFQMLPAKNLTTQNFGKDFAGIRYPLACWLDEIFTSGSSPWADQWNEQKIEVELYSTNDRAWKFWNQAKLSEEFTSTDELEIFFLCTVFGFKGTLIENPSELEGWQKKTAARLNSTKKFVQQDWDTEFQTNVPPRKYAYAYKKMKNILSILLTILLPYFIFVFFFSQTH